MSTSRAASKIITVTGGFGPKFYTVLHQGPIASSLVRYYEWNTEERRVSNWCWIRNRSATAKRFAREGANVVVADIDEEGGRETVAKIKEQGGEATFVEADVSKKSDVEKMVVETANTYGQLDFAHNNAGIGAKMVPLTEQTEET